MAVPVRQKTNSPTEHWVRRQLAGAASTYAHNVAARSGRDRPWSLGSMEDSSLNRTYGRDIMGAWR
jgi:hypothetical protein